MVTQVVWWSDLRAYRFFDGLRDSIAANGATRLGWLLCQPHASGEKMDGSVKFRDFWQRQSRVGLALKRHPAMCYHPVLIRPRPILRGVSVLHCPIFVTAYFSAQPTTLEDGEDATGNIFPEYTITLPRGAFNQKSCYPGKVACWPVRDRSWASNEFSAVQERAPWATYILLFSGDLGIHVMP